MANGTVTDATWSGAAVQSGWTLRTAGATLTNYPTGNSPGQGMLPYLVEEAIAQGAVDGDRYIIRRATNGVTLVNPGTDTNLAGIRDDVTALGVGDPDVLIIWLGANDAQTQAEYDAVAADTGLLRLVRLARAEFPDTAILLMGEETGDPTVTYPFVDELNTLRAAVAAAVPFCAYVSIAGVDLTDDIHPSAAGYEFCATAAAAEWRG